ncbi:MAG: pilus assembly protein [Acidimicrobiia bacterium]|nr:pilus assembly protein [Acidimicrobiia bacterium]
MIRRDVGSAVAEFAIVLPLVLVVLVASVELVSVARVQLEVTHAAREGARQAATSVDPALAVAAVRSALPSSLAADARVSVTRPQRVGAQAEVRVRMPYRFAAALFGGMAIELSARAVMRVEQ